MILLCGIPSEPPLALVAKALEERGAPYLLFNQRQFASAAISFEITGGRAAGSLQIDGAVHRLDDIAGVYTRLMDYRRLPELAGVPESADAYRYCAALNDTLARWCEICDARVVNRMAPMGSNSSKPYQAQLIRRYGFYVPATLVTIVPSKCWRFASVTSGSSTNRSAACARSCRPSKTPIWRVSRRCAGPTQFQQYVEGYDGVHVVGRGSSQPRSIPARPIIDTHAPRQARPPS